MNATPTPTARQLIEQARDILRDNNPSLLAAADALVALGQARWIEDPEVTGVVGLVEPEPFADYQPTSRPLTALLVVYVEDGDFTADERRFRA